MFGLFIAEIKLYNFRRDNFKLPGLAEPSFVLEAAGLGCGVLYNILKGHPFETWGELSFLFFQCLLQICFYWRFTTDPDFRLAPRILIMVFYLGALLAVFVSPSPPSPFFLSTLGLLPMVIGTGSRLPQLLLNYRQQHTGTLSLVTWVLSLGGNAMRVITTFALVADPVTLAGHSAALAVNFGLVAQIILYWNSNKNLTKKKQ